jgi:sulfite oxidase
LASAGLIVGVAELVSVPIAADSSPVTAFGSLVVDHTPNGMREWVIRTVGTNDKHLLFTVIGIGAVVISIVAGLVERPRRPVGSLLFTAFGAVGVYAALTRPGATWTHALPTVVGAVLGIVALHRLTSRLDRERPMLEADQRVPRREILRGLAVVAGLAAATGVLGRALAGRGRWRFPASPPTSLQTAPSTESTPRSPCHNCPRRTGRCASTAWSTARSTCPTPTCPAARRRPRWSR